MVGEGTGWADLGGVVRSFLAADEPAFGAGVDLVIELDGVVAGGGGTGIPVAGVTEG